MALNSSRTCADLTITKDVPIIILSSERSDESNKRGKEVGADVYIEKPFDADKIKYQVSKYLALK